MPTSSFSLPPARWSAAVSNGAVRAPAAPGRPLRRHFAGILLGRFFAGSRPPPGSSSSFFPPPPPSSLPLPPSTAWLSPPFLAGRSLLPPLTQKASRRRGLDGQYLRVRLSFDPSPVPSPSSSSLYILLNLNNGDRANSPSVAVNLPGPSFRGGFPRDRPSPKPPPPTDVPLARRVSVVALDVNSE